MSPILGRITEVGLSILFGLSIIAGIAVAAWRPRKDRPTELVVCLFEVALLVGLVLIAMLLRGR